MGTINLYNVIPFAHHLLSRAIHKGAFVVDATVGNGHDTLFLAKQVGPSGRVLGFDVQPEALSAAEKRLRDAQVDGRVDLVLESHADMSKVLQNNDLPNPQAAVFNLGYLPGSNKEVVTKAASTLQGVEQLLTLMPKNGLVVIVIYSGHPGGKNERDALLSWTSVLDPQKFLSARYEFTNRTHAPPFLLAIEKL